MQTHQFIGTVLIVAGTVDAATSFWLPNRIPDERQRLIVRVALLASAVVVVTLGAMFLYGVVGQEQTLER